MQKIKEAQEKKTPAQLRKETMSLSIKEGSMASVAGGLLRLLGNCPNCNAEDEITKTPDSRKTNDPLYGLSVRCGGCGRVWEDWIKLILSERTEGKELIPVQVIRPIPTHVYLAFPYDNIPYRKAIISVLNSALMAKFGLEVAFCCEGGLIKYSPRHGYEIRNFDEDKIGLWFEEGIEEASVPVFDFYEKIMRQLFEEPMQFKDLKLRRGEILRMGKEATETDASIYLFCAITKTAGKKFAEKVLLTKQKNDRNPFTASHISGLTQEDIKRFFIPRPPYHSD